MSLMHGKLAADRALSGPRGALESALPGMPAVVDSHRSGTELIPESTPPLLHSRTPLKRI